MIKKIKKTFKGRASEVYDLMRTLKKHPEKGSLITQVSGIQLRELRFDDVFRLYFFSNGELVKMLDENELQIVLIKFIEMSKKDDQQTTIERLKRDLRSYGFDWF